MEDLDRYQWPSPDWYDYDALPGITEHCEDRAISVGYSAVFTYRNYLRGLECSLVDPFLNPDNDKDDIRKY